MRPESEESDRERVRRSILLLTSPTRRPLTPPKVIR